MTAVVSSVIDNHELFASSSDKLDISGAPLNKYNSASNSVLQAKNKNCCILAQDAVNQRENGSTV